MKKALWLYDKFVYYPIFLFSLMFMSITARLKLIRTTSLVARMNAKLVLLSRRGRMKFNIDDMGREWRRMFPNDMQRLLSRDEDTVYYETHTWCPLRGTGDVVACYRIMEFDRSMHETIGGQFVVISSQAEPGRKTCVVAIRRPEVPSNDLVHAHERVANETETKVSVMQLEEQLNLLT